MFEYSKKLLDHFKNPRNHGRMENPDGVGREGNPRCLASHTLIQTNPKIIEIQNVKTKQKVLGHDGKFHRIKAVYSRKYQGKLLKLKINNLGEMLVTPDHLILAAAASHFPYKYRIFKRHREKIVVGWRHAEELERGDLILYPIPKEIKDVKSIKFNIRKPYWDFKSRELPNNIKVGYDFLRLVGYYIAEGYASTKKCKGFLNFSFGAHEKEYIEDVILIMKKIFNLNPVERKIRNNCVRINFNSARLARFFKRNFGKGAAAKRVPGWMLYLPTRKQRYLLRGLWRGDGYIDKKYQRAKFVTISKTLADQMRYLLLKRKIIYSFMVGKAYGIHKKSYCFYVQHDPSLKQIAGIMGKEFKIRERNRNTHKSWFDDNFYYTTISNIASQDYQDLVYNLEVDNSHSYVAQAATVHNCGDVMELFIKVKDNYISDIKFLTFGCVAALGISSILTETIKGKTVDEAKKITTKELLKEVGEIPPVKYHCSVLGIQALQEAIKDYEKRKR